MRNLQIVLFVIAVLSFIMALIYVGSVTGDIFWRAGIAILFVDVVFIMLWPGKTKFFLPKEGG
jgi:hypothetical protein